MIEKCNYHTILQRHCNPAPRTLYPKCSKQSLQSLASMLCILHLGLMTIFVLKRQWYFNYFDRNDKSHTARINKHSIDPGLELNPHLTVDDISCKS